jgi:hypothetical protein
MNEIVYNDEFYKERYKRTIKSARALLPIIIDLIKPSSVIDFGCADGIWLSVFNELGISDFIGVDGDFVDRNHLYIPINKFITHDLSTSFVIDKKFDLAISLEVAEHLPEEKSELFIQSIISTSNVVLFSAAIPYQGGVNHYNEQWQDYWARLFQGFGYKTLDIIRNQIWDNDEIAPYYRQNILLFVNEENPHFFDESCLNEYPINIIHPEIYLQKIRQIKNLQNKKSSIIKRFIRKLKKWIRINHR